MSNLTPDERKQLIDGFRAMRVQALLPVLAAVGMISCLYLLKQGFFTAGVAVITATVAILVPSSIWAFRREI